jgi:cobalt-zinc-cadmium efflux system membrane fusion protein
VRGARIAWLALLFAAPALAADAPQPLKLTPSQLAALKLATVKPQPRAQVPLPPAPARVTVPPQAERVVSAPRSGLVLRVLAAEGDRVAKGATLAEIDSPEVVALQRDFLNARSAAELARVAAERDRALFADGVIAERRLLQTEQAYREQQTTLAAVRQLLASAGFADADLARLVDTQRFVNALPVKSPIAGVVLKRLASPGERVGEQQPLYRVADPSTLWVEAQLPAESLAGVAVGAPAEVIGCDASGKVIAIGAAADPVTQTVVVRAALAKPCPAMRPGQVMQVRVFAPTREPVLTVPQQSVVRRGEQSWVFVKGADAVSAVPVDVAAIAAGHAFIRSGLAGDADVATTGIATLKAAWTGMGGE